MYAEALHKGPVSRENVLYYWSGLQHSHPRSGAWGESESTDFRYSRS